MNGKKGGEATSAGPSSKGQKGKEPLVTTDSTATSGDAASASTPMTTNATKKRQATAEDTTASSANTSEESGISSANASSASMTTDTPGSPTAAKTKTKNEVPAEAATSVSGQPAGGKKTNGTRTFNHAKYLLSDGSDTRKFNPANRSLGAIGKLLNPGIPELQPAIKQCIEAHKNIVNDGLLRLGSRLRKAIEVRSNFQVRIQYVMSNAV